MVSIIGYLMNTSVGGSGLVLRVTLLSSNLGKVIVYYLLKYDRLDVSFRDNSSLELLIIKALNHWILNVLDPLPRKERSVAREMLGLIPYAETQVECERR